MNFLKKKKKGFAVQSNYDATTIVVAWDLIGPESSTLKCEGSST